MKFNPTKCAILTVTNKINPIYSQYSLYNQTLQHVSEAKYLGLILDQNLNFNKHIDNILCKRTNVALGFIKRNTYYCQRHVKIDAYYTYVRPIMDCAAFAWSPHTTKSINKLEAVQRRAACCVMSNYNRNSSVSNMLATLNRKSLKRYSIFNHTVQNTSWIS